MSSSRRPSSSGSSHRRSSGSDDVPKEAPLVRSSPRKLRLPPANGQPDRQAFIDLQSDEEFPALPSSPSSSEGDNGNIITACVETAMR